ncbi:MAG: carboxypeptidase regulatory-like domain-containing protein, partial [Candidatus Diapherotrites archaeon]|nr:carboxypeptidase regulatory-like domain-containing protein [Candidatus Diapherotrites archaeon]
MSFTESLKKFYFALEDRYYAVLDKINRHIPVYKVIDPIDKYVPSFMLFVLLILLLIFWLLLLPVIGPFIFPSKPSVYYVSVKLIDAETGDVLVGVPVTLNLIDFNKILKEDTSEAGIAVFEVPAEQVDVLLSVSAEDYEEIKEKRMVLVADVLKTIELKKVGLYFAENKIELFVVKRAVGSPKIEDRTITITFTCKRGTPPAPINKPGSEQPFEVTKPKDCEELSGTAVAQGFKPQTLLLEGKKTVIFKLEETETDNQKGKIAITIYEYDNTYASDVTVRLYDSQTARLVGQKTTDASGTALFEKLDPGYYDVGVVAGDGRIATEENIKVNAGETTRVDIILPEPQEENNKKLFFKVVSADTQTPVHNAIAFIYAESFFLAEVHTDENGIGSYEISASNTDKNFRALITHPNFIQRVIELPMLPLDAARPTLIELTPKSQHNINFAPVPLITADKYFGQVPLEVNFDASQSFDPDGTITTYSWDFG